MIWERLKPWIHSFVIFLQLLRIACCWLMLLPFPDTDSKWGFLSNSQIFQKLRPLLSNPSIYFLLHPAYQDLPEVQQHSIFGFAFLITIYPSCPWKDSQKNEAKRLIQAWRDLLVFHKFAILHSKITLGSLHLTTISVAQFVIPLQKRYRKWAFCENKLISRHESLARLKRHKFSFLQKFVYVSVSPFEWGSQCCKSFHRNNILLSKVWYTIFVRFEWVYDSIFLHCLSLQAFLKIK